MGLGDLLSFGSGGSSGSSGAESSGFGLGDALGVLGGGLALYGMYDAYTSKSDSGGTQTAKQEPYARDASGQMLWNSFMESLMGTNNYKAAMTPQTPATSTASTYSLGSSSTPILDSLSSRDYSGSRMNGITDSGLAGTGASMVGASSSQGEASVAPSGFSLSDFFGGLKTFGKAFAQENRPQLVRIGMNIKQQQQLAQLQEDLAQRQTLADIMSIDLAGTGIDLTGMLGGGGNSSGYGSGVRDAYSRGGPAHVGAGGTSAFGM